jgi:hypothetical protein
LIGTISGEGDHAYHMEPRMSAKTHQEYVDDINNFIAAREWHRQRLADGTATDEDAPRSTAAANSPLWPALPA